MNIIITGASKGIGKAIAIQFAKSGNRLLLCSRNEAELEALTKEFSQRFPDTVIHTRVTDMGIREDVFAFADWCLQYGAPDILINNAGQFIPGKIQDEAEGVLEKMIDVNLYSAYHLTRKLLPSMMLAKKGHIFNICSIASLQAYTNGGSYSISKFALMGFSKNLRLELQSHGIKVTAVAPGATMSSSWDGFEIDRNRIMESKDIALMVYAAAQLSPQAVVEDIIMRPQLGDL